MYSQRYSNHVPLSKDIRSLLVRERRVPSNTIVDIHRRRFRNSSLVRLIHFCSLNSARRTGGRGYLSENCVVAELTESCAGCAWQTFRDDGFHCDGAKVAS